MSGWTTAFLPDPSPEARELAKCKCGQPLYALVELRRGQCAVCSVKANYIHLPEPKKVSL